MDPKGDTTYIYSSTGIYKGVILDKLKTNEVVVMSDVSFNAVMGLQGKYSSEIVAKVARNPIFADARFTENTVKELTKFSTSSSEESAGLLYVDSKTKEVKISDCPTCKVDSKIKDVTSAGEADPKSLSDIEGITATKGKIIGYWHTHPENTFIGSQPSSGTGEDYYGNGYVKALYKGGIGAIVNAKTITLYQLADYSKPDPSADNLGTVPASSQNAKNDNLLTPKFDKNYPKGAQRSSSQHGVLNEKLSPQTKWKK